MISDSVIRKSDRSKWKPASHQIAHYGKNTHINVLQTMITKYSSGSYIHCVTNVEKKNTIVKLLKIRPTKILCKNLILVNKIKINGTFETYRWTSCGRKNSHTERV